MVSLTQLLESCPLVFIILPSLQIIVNYAYFRLSIVSKFTVSYLNLGIIFVYLFISCYYFITLLHLAITPDGEMLLHTWVGDPAVTVVQERVHTAIYCMAIILIMASNLLITWALVMAGKQENKDVFKQKLAAPDSIVIQHT